MQKALKALDAGSSTSEVQTSFHYVSSIGANHVRLLSLTRESPVSIQGRLETRPLKALKRPWTQYFALSYCWGTEKRSEVLQINDQPFTVTPNLLTGLQAVLRYAEGEGRKCYLWVDAICIDQTSDEEQSAQVPLMRQIYSNAKRVLVWLGSEADASDAIMSVLIYMDVYAQRYFTADNIGGLWFRRLLGYDSRIAGYTDRLEQHEPKMIEDYGIDHNIPMAFLTILAGAGDIKKADDEPHRNQALKELYQEEASRGRLPARRDQFWMHYYKLMTRPWFYRIWTYQEILLAKDAVVLCGGDHVSWNIVLACRHCISLYDVADILHFSKRQGLDPSLSLHLGGASRSRQDAWLPVGPRGEPGGLPKLIIDMDERQAVRKKDYIYGLLGLVDDETRKRIRVDYQKSDAEVYTDAMASCCSFLSTQRFGAFWSLMMETYIVTGTHRMADLPSWCPDFSSGSRGINKFATNEHYTMGTVVSNRIMKHWKIEQADLSEDSTRLTISVLLLDSVQQVSTLAANPYRLKLVEGTLSECVDWLEFDRLRDHFCAWLDTRKQLLSSCALSHDNLCDLMWPPDVRQLATAPKSLQASELEAVENLCAVTKAMGLATYEEASTAAEPLRIDSNRVYRLIQYMGQALKSQLCRYHFVTREGIVGHSAKPLQQGDLLCYFPRGSTLHALRDEGRYSRYITLACMDGTGGDGLAKFFDSPEMWSTFTLI